MLIHQTYEVLRILKLIGLLEALERQQSDPAVQALSFEERLALLLEAELNRRQQRTLERLLRAAKLKEAMACVEDIDYQAKRKLNRNQITTLNSCEWVERHQHVIVTGATGTGKTWLACAWAKACIRKGIPVLYYRLSRLLEESEIARADGSLVKLRSKIAKARLLVLDDWLVNPLSPLNRQDLLEFIEDRTGSGSIIITSQMPTSAWMEAIGEPTIAEAIFDRIIHRSHKVEIAGPSMREVHSPLKEAVA